MLHVFTEMGKEIGFGHVSRSFSLYKEAENLGIKVKLYIYNVDKIDFKDLIGAKVDYVNWMDISYLKEVIKSNDYCIVDSYIANQDIYIYISMFAKNVVYLDDFYRIDYPKGIICNPSLAKIETENFSSTEEKQFLSGKDYVILRNSFLNEYGFEVNKVIDSLTIIMGGSDIKEKLTLLLKYVEEVFSDITINVVYNYDIEFKSKKNNHIKFYSNLNSNEIKKLFLSSDLVVTGSGQTVYELIALNVPFLAVKIIDNQQGIVNELKLLNLYVINDIDYEAENFLSCLNNLKCFEIRKKLSMILKTLIDGKGASRIIRSLIYQQINENLYLRKIEIKDIEEVFKLSNKEYVRKFSLNNASIKWETHSDWFNKTINDDDCLFFGLVDIKDKFLGQVRFNIEEKSAIISISLNHEIHGIGIGGKTLSISLGLLKQLRTECESVIAIVKNENKASIRMFLSKGFTLNVEENGISSFIYSFPERIG